MDSYSILHESNVTKPNIKFSGTIETLVLAWCIPKIKVNLNTLSYFLEDWIDLLELE